MMMQATQVRKMENPHTWAFRQCLYGRAVNIPYFSKIVREYYNEQMFDLLDQTMQLTGHIAVSSGRLSRHMRSKYRQKRIEIGRNTYYLFDRSKVPSDIGAVIDFKSLGCIYG